MHQTVFTRIPPLTIPYPGQFQAPFGKPKHPHTWWEYSKGYASCFNVTLRVTLVTWPEGLAGTEWWTMVTA